MVDRPSTDWLHFPDGLIAMTVAPTDLQPLLVEALTSRRSTPL